MIELCHTPFCRCAFILVCVFNILKEFADANKLLRTAPPCVYSETTKPKELLASGVREGPNVSFLAFGMSLVV